MNKVFFIGINGIGMSALAKYMKTKGYDVYGSDIVEKNTTEVMRNMGIKIYSEHKAENVVGMDTVIYTTAIKADNKEYNYAKDNNIKIYKRGELLAKLMNEETGIAVAGTHGKTTTSSMIGISMLEKDATIVVGGIITEINSNARIGNSNYFIAEADESDNSFLYMKPKYSIITNIEEDHMDFHKNYDNLKQSFKKFIENTLIKVIVNKDCETLYNISKEYKHVIYYSLYDKTADIYVDNMEKNESGEMSYTVVKNGENLGSFSLAIPGLHNISNSLGVIYLSHEFSVDLENLKNKLTHFKGAKRRFDILHNEGITIVDDYAHHPTEIKATLQAAKERAKNRVIAVFQPHRYSRLSFLIEDFSKSFTNADEVILLPVYSAGEENCYNIKSENLLKKICNYKAACCINDEHELQNIIIEKSNPGDIYVFMGAGNISQMAYKIAEKYKKNIE
ncbi:MAG: UDP-N-acetylmuramate--L-alanine ligase [Fusobacteria bacterium]|nr:UDP-N-acetylmuramate--L-alanine ligase [Fusobacteriota bacterium]